MKKKLINTTVMFLSFFYMMTIFTHSALAGTTLDRIYRRGVVLCGTNTDIEAYAEQNYETKKWSGFDVDVCKAVASALLGDAEKIKFVKATTTNRLAKLKRGDFDILLGVTPWTIAIDAGKDFSSVDPMLFSGQGFMAHSIKKMDSMKDFKGLKVCVQKGTPSFTNLDEYNRREKLDLKIISLPNFERTKEFFFLKRCHLLAEDIGVLNSKQFTSIPDGMDVVILPEIFAFTPFGPTVRGDDDELFTIMKWLRLALIKAEQKGITKNNIDTFLTSESPEIQLLLGVREGFGSPLKIDKKWAYRAIKSVGNYGEIYDRNFGENTPFKFKRGLNNIVKNGGAMYAPPFYR